MRYLLLIVAVLISGCASQRAVHINVTAKDVATDRPEVDVAVTVVSQL